MPANEARELRKLIEKLQVELRNEQQAHQKAAARVHKLERKLVDAEARAADEQDVESNALAEEVDTLRRQLHASQRALEAERAKAVEHRKKEGPKRDKHSALLHAQLVGFPMFSKKTQRLELACAFGDRLSPQQLISVDLGERQALFWYFGDPAPRALGTWYLHVYLAKDIDDAGTLAREVPREQIVEIDTAEGHGLVVWYWMRDPRD